MWQIRTEGPAAGDIICRSHPCVGFLPCDGRKLFPADYPDLERAIGNVFGDPCSDLIQLPDLRRFVPTKINGFNPHGKYGIQVTTYEPPKEEPMDPTRPVPTKQILEGHILEMEEKHLAARRQRRELELAIDAIDRQIEDIDAELATATTLLGSA